MKPGHGGNSFTLRRRIFTFFLLGGLGLMALASAVVYDRLSKSIVDSIEAQGRDAMALLERQLSLFVRNEERKLFQAHSYFRGDDEALLAYIRSLEDYEAVTLAGPDGRVIAASDPLRKGFSYRGIELFERCLATERPVFDIDFHPLDGRLVISLVLPIRSGSNGLRAVAFHHMKPGVMESALGDLLDRYGRDMVVFDRNGIIFFKFTGAQAAPASAKPYSLLDFGMDVTKLGSGFVTTQTAKDGEHLITTGRMAALSGYIAAKSSLALLRQSQETVTLLSLAFFALAAGIFAALGMALSRGILRPISELTRQVGDMVAGKAPAISIPPSELSVVAEAFNAAWAENVSIRERLQVEKREAEAAREQAEAARAEAEEANRTKSRFLANMSHELRTPLNAIIGFAHLSLSDQPAGPASGHLRKIHRSAQSLLGIIEDILDATKLESGTVKLASEAFDLRALIGEACELLAPQAAAKGLAFELDLDPDLPRHLRGDPARIRQILVNLVGNAVKFTESGSVGLSAASEEADVGKASLSFTVKDTGPGIPLEFRKRLFEPFFQADSSSRRRYGGSGLGLSIARDLAAAMGGSLELLDSSPGQGASFRFTATLERASPAEIRPPSTKIAPIAALSGACGNEHGESPQGVRILLVEDNATNQELALSILSRACMNVDLARNGREALAMAEKGGYKAILMDIQMPVMDGYEATALIRALPDPEKAGVPILAMTADAFPEDRERCLKAGMNDFVSKPFDPDELVRKIAELVGMALAPRGEGLSGRPSAGPPEDGGHLDLSRGLRLVGGDPESFGRILRSFSEDSIALRETIMRAAGSDAREAKESLRRAVHTLKGMAGNIGASALYALARDMERPDAPPAPAFLESLYAELDAVLEVAARAAAELGGRRSAPTPARAVPTLLEEIRERLSLDYLVSDDLIEELERAVEEAPLEPPPGGSEQGPEAGNSRPLSELIRALKDLDYPKSRKILEELAPSLGLPERIKRHA